MAVRGNFCLLVMLWLLVSLDRGYAESVLPRGHHERPDSPEVASGRKRPIAEFEASAAVLISHHLAEKADKLSMLLHIAQHFPVYLLMPRNHQGAEDPRVLPLLAAARDSGLFAPDGLGLPFAFFSNSVDGEDGLEAWAKGIWARDWGPLSVEWEDERPLPVASSSQTTVLADFNYYPSRRYTNATPWGLYQFVRGQSSGWSEPASEPQLLYKSVPVYNEGGNFLTDGLGTCFLSERPLRANEDRVHEQDVRLELRDIRPILERDIGCTRVFFPDSMPHEQTGHIDMWAKFIDTETVLIGELMGSQERFVPDRFLSDFREMRAFLNSQAIYFERRGYRTVRVPQPVPLFRSNGRTVVRSYVNSLLLNRGPSGRPSRGDRQSGTSTLYVPRYVSPGSGLRDEFAFYPDSDLIPEYESRLLDAVAAQGIDLFFVPSDDLITQGGAVHCVTMQIHRMGLSLVGLGLPEF